MPKHTHFVGKALVGLRPAERLVDSPIVADTHLRPQRILDLVHAGANMAHEQDQASSEALPASSLSECERVASPDPVARLDHAEPS
jgi:hypothetical protein